jgi:nucleoside-diphosphate-sugar epimerase
MRILITGNLGYVGAGLVSHLRRKYPDAFIAGYDLGYFQNCLTTPSVAPESKLDIQYYGDVRNFDESILNNIDHVIHLAAISNDPIGNKFGDVTIEVNANASIDIAKKAIARKVKSFVFASSCSVYGAGGDEVKSEISNVDPLTPYAISKVQTENALAKLDRGDTIITCLRFATACGISDRLRLDLVLNDFVASALTFKKIEILSDGTPWRPLINVKDMARAIDWSINRNGNNGGGYLVCNAGSNEWNFTVKELADYVSAYLGGIEISVNPNAPADKRSYRVNFDLFTSLATGFLPEMNVVKTIDELVVGLKKIEFNDINFRKSNFIRLNILNSLIENNTLNEKLSWEK